MNKNIKRILKITLIPTLTFILGHIALYTYSYITQKPEINKSQGYYLYDKEYDLVSGSNDNWISLDKISPY